MEKIIIKPISTKSEVTWLFITIAIVILVAGSAISLRVRPGDEKVLKNHQISAFKDLNTLDQGTFNDLYAAALEINELHMLDEGTWPTPQSLADEYIPPFVKDQVWIKRGKISWQLQIPDFKTGHLALYFGAPSDVGDYGCFLLIMRHNHEQPQPGKKIIDHGPYEIWHNKNIKAEFPKIVTDPALIAKGWKEVAPYKGEEEVKRLKGEIL